MANKKRTTKTVKNTADLAGFLASDKAFVSQIDFVISGLLSDAVAYVKEPDPDRSVKEVAYILQVTTVAKTASSAAWARITGIEAILESFNAGQPEIGEVRDADTPAAADAIVVPEAASFGDENS